VTRETQARSQANQDQLYRGLPPPLGIPNYPSTSVGTPYNYRSSSQSEGLGLSQLRPPGYSHVGSLADQGYTPDPRGALDAMYGTYDSSQRSSIYQPGRGQSRVGVPAFPRSRYTRRSGLSLHQIATTQRPTTPFQSKEVHAFIQYIYQLIRAEAFDETVLEKLID